MTSTPPPHVLPDSSTSAGNDKDQVVASSSLLVPPSVETSQKDKSKKARNRSIDLKNRSTELGTSDKLTTTSSSTHKWYNRSPASSSSSSLVRSADQPQLSSSATLSPHPPPASSNDTLPLPTGSSSRNKKTRSRSIGSLHLLTNALSRTSSSSSSSSSSNTANQIRPITPPSPTSTSKSNVSARPPPPVVLGETRKSSTSSSSSNSSSLLQVANCSLMSKSNKNRSKSPKRSEMQAGRGQEEGLALGEEEEWANVADLNETDEQGRIISEEMVRARSETSSSQISGKSGKSGKSGNGGNSNGSSPVLGASSQGQGGGGGKFVQSLRRTRSKLGLIGKGKEAEDLPTISAKPAPVPSFNREEVEDDGMMMVGSPVMTFVEPPSPSEQKSFGDNLEVGGRNGETPTIISTSPTLESFSSSSNNRTPSSPPSDPAQTTTATQRIGGWFSSMLNQSTSSSPGRSSTHSSPNTSPEKQIPRQRTHSSHSPSSARTFFSSPTKKVSTSSLSLPPSSPSSSSTTTTTGLTTSASRLGPLDRMLDKAVQYFLDTDSNADKCPDDIWLFGGVKHEGWRPPLSSVDGDGFDDSESLGSGGGGGAKPNSKRWSPIKARATRQQRERQQSRDTVNSRSSREGADESPSPSLRSFSTTDSSSFAHSPSSPEASPPQTTINGWPASFFQDFYSRPALTYRSHFTPIPCSPSKPGGGGATGAMHGMFNSLSLSIGRGGSGGNARDSTRGGVGEENGGLSSDTGWGCMLRTGQSLLANALVTAHLGRDWRRPVPPSSLPSPPPHGQPAPPLLNSAALPQSYATYARILSLFLDTPSPASPFSVHKFALEGQRLGKSVGEWFGPSTAAGAIKKLVNDFEPAGIRVVSCVDGTLYENEVVAASTTMDEKWSTKVLVLINLRLGIDGVNPLYHEAIKGIFQIPQSVGIAGGRPSSSYYFVGSQANSLFYIDPHHPRPAVSIVDLPSELNVANSRIPLASSPVSTPDPSNPAELDAERVMLDSFFATAYDDSAWRTYHCDKVRKCALSSLDPSMLVGFLIQDQRDWEDFKLRATELGQSSSAIFSIAPAPPKWMRRSSSTALPPPQTAASMSVSPGDDSFSELDEESIVNRPAAHEGGVAEPFEEDDVEFSEPEGWELDSTDASDNDSLREQPTRVGASSPRRPTVFEDDVESKSDEENDPVFVDSRTSMHSRESTRGTH